MTQENNDLIAEFMGGKFSHPHWSLPKTGRWTQDKLQYHKSWDWLMPVVRKCWKDASELDICSADMLADRDFWSVADGDREKSYKAVVEFIKFYNKSKK